MSRTAIALVLVLAAVGCGDKPSSGSMSNGDAASTAGTTVGGMAGDSVAGAAGTSAGAAGDGVTAGAGSAGAAAVGGSAGANMSTAGDGATAGMGEAGMGAGQAGVCGGATPHGCYVAQDGNHPMCPATTPEQSAYYPPQAEWNGCNGIMPAAPFGGDPKASCSYKGPAGEIATCLCDTGLHWLCTYP